MGTILNPRWLPAVAVFAVLALASLGCGGDDGNGGSQTGTGSGQVADGVEEAERRAADAQEPSSGFEAPGEAFDASAASGKTIFLISPLSIPFAQQNADGLKEAAGEVGAKVVAYDSKAQVNGYVQGIEQAISQKAGVILIESFPVSLFTAQLKRAQAAGIPVISVENHDPGPPLPTDPEAVKASVDQCHACAGRAMADFTIADSDGNANAVIIWSSDVAGIGRPQVDAIQEEFSELCPDCNVQVVDAPLAQWSTRLSGLTRSTLTANPDVDYLLPLYDGMVSFIEPAVRQANAADRVKIVSFNATPSVMKSLESGGMVAADVGVGNVRLGWAIADQAFRVLAGTQPVDDPNIPVRLFTAENIDEIDVDAKEETWFGDPAEWRDGYKELWGVGS